MAKAASSVRDTLVMMAQMMSWGFRLDDCGTEVQCDNWLAVAGDFTEFSWKVYKMKDFGAQKSCKFSSVVKIKHDLFCLDMLS